MNCPKCGAAMEQVEHANVVVDRCTDCKGLWFDLRERETLKKIAGSEAIDTGDPGKGAELNTKDRIDCPRCKTRLVRMIDLKQRHIWYESCNVCGGVFFDAGEFKDYKSSTLADVFRDWFAKART